MCKYMENLLADLFMKVTAPSARTTQIEGDEDKDNGYKFKMVIASSQYQTRYALGIKRNKKQTRHKIYQHKFFAQGQFIIFKQMKHCQEAKGHILAMDLERCQQGIQNYNLIALAQHYYIIFDKWARSSQQSQFQ